MSKRTPKDGAKVALASPLFLPEMTEKQARALLAAAKAGYYEFPRNATTEEVSTSLGVARSTFEQHLNRAEHHVVRAMLPIVRMRAGMPQGEALEVYSRFSRELGLYVRLEVLGDRVASVSLSKGPTPASAGSDHPYLARILEHIRTGEDDLRDIPLHLELSPFEREVLELLRAIPPGIIVIPCHRVVPASGGLGNYSGEGGPETKRRLLEREGARLAAPGIARHPTNEAARTRPLARSRT